MSYIILKSYTKKTNPDIATGMINYSPKLLLYSILNFPINTQIKCINNYSN